MIFRLDVTLKTLLKFFNRVGSNNTYLIPLNYNMAGISAVILKMPGSSNLRFTLAMDE